MSTWLSLCSLSCERCSAAPNRSDPLPTDPHNHPRWLWDMWMAPWTSPQPGHPSQSTQWSTSILELEHTGDWPQVKWVALIMLIDGWSYVSSDTHRGDWKWEVGTQFHWWQALQERVIINSDQAVLKSHQFLRCDIIFRNEQRQCSNGPEKNQISENVNSADWSFNTYT